MDVGPGDMDLTTDAVGAKGYGGVFFKGSGVWVLGRKYGWRQGSRNLVLLELFPVVPALELWG